MTDSENASAWGRFKFDIQIFNPQCGDNAKYQGAQMKTATTGPEFHYNLLINTAMHNKNKSVRTGF